MSVALRLYEQLTEAGEDKARAKFIADAFEALEVSHLPLTDVATQSQVRETELRLQKEIAGVRLEVEQVRLEIRETEGKLRKEIELVRREIKEIEASLRVEIKAVEVKVAETKAELIRWVVAMGVLQTSLLTGVLLKVAHLI